MSILKLKLIKAYFIDNLNKGFIEPLTALFAALVLFAKKQDGSFRFCIDFRALNNLTRKDRYPFLLIDKTLARLLKAKIFTKLDIRQAFHRIRIDPASKELTTFKTRYAPAKLNYVVYDKEILAIIRSFDNFRAELASSLYQVQVITDHKALNFRRLKLALVIRPKSLRPTRFVNQYYRNYYACRRASVLRDKKPVIDRFFKQAISILCHKSIDAKGLAKLYIYYIYKYFKALLTLTSNKGPQYWSEF
ncbi:polymerase [Drepanopeziza brunnea f. sp. 'multigermtubi' MB_m1]|uniref:Polymerase n=1 Tax=Marssonina brunnea f. sp. multigermtubi (strain MB_m1) TaxID=1072389 RepID=K1WXR9_MARBU|nr:polymerase [Drepanopeziza brunnea f. sp. 'multigermtubi' MB_m1]EKD17352.1 polymerase [Drepanopeziza brunnea f. sp. 'multigermtubi' MB_m1]